MDAATELAQVDADIAAINAAISARLTGGAVDSYGINGRSVTRAKLSELEAMLEKRMRRRAALSGASRVDVEFGRPT